MRIPACLADVPPERALARETVLMALLRAAADPSEAYRHLYEAIRDARELEPDWDPGRCPPITVPHPGGAPSQKDQSARQLANRVLECGEQLPELEELEARLEGVSAARSECPTDGLPAFLLRELAEQGMASIEFSEQVGAGWPGYASPWTHSTRENAALIILDKIERAERRGTDAADFVRSLAAVVALQRFWDPDAWSPATWNRMEVLSTREFLDSSAWLIRWVLESPDINDRVVNLVLTALRSREQAGTDRSKASRFVKALALSPEEPDPEVPEPTPLMIFAGRAFSVAFSGFALDLFTSTMGSLSDVPDRKRKIAQGHEAFADAWRYTADMCLNRVVRRDPPPEDDLAAICAAIALGHLGLRYDPYAGGSFVQSLEVLLARAMLENRLARLANDVINAVRMGLRENGSVPMIRTLPEQAVFECLNSVLPSAAAGTSESGALRSADKAASGPARDRLVLRPGGGPTGDLAIFGGVEYPLSGGKLLVMLQMLQSAGGRPVSASAIELETGERASRTVGRMPPALAAIIERPAKRGLGYRML